jgi:adenylate kinase family enzyme
MRIAIIGSPRAGKTTLAHRMAERLRFPLFHSDDLIHLGWWAVADELARRIPLDQTSIWEGVSVVRGLRRLLQLGAAPPVARCIVLEYPRVKLTAEQEIMRRGCATILRKIEPELLERGVEMVRDVEAA